MSEHEPHLTGILLGRYRLIEPIGQGGMGSVWKAQQLEPIEREVAVKLIKPGMDTAAVLEGFKTERQILARLDHPNIATIFDAGSTDNGRPYYVMELVKGQPITDYCDQHGLDTTARLTLFKVICQAVEHAHEKGIIHRDIKPTNILVASHGAEARLKVIDFGIAKALDADTAAHTLVTEDGQIIGTPGYMSPEHAEGRSDIDGRTDVYSLGALLYELLSGTPPIKAKTLQNAGLLEVMRIIREEEPPPPGTSSDLDWITLKALAKKPAQRYERPTAIVADINRFQRHETTTASAPSFVTRLGKALRRHRAAVLVATIAVLAVLATGTITQLARPQSVPGLVTSSADAGSGSLRATIASAKPGSTIRFADELTDQTITLDGTALTIAKSLTIDARDRRITIDAAGKSPLIELPSSAVNVELIGLTLTGGQGHAIRNDGAILTLKQCQLLRMNCPRNFAIVNLNGAALTMEACLIADGTGGAITGCPSGTLDLTHCTIARNHAENISGILALGECRMSYCTVADNVSSVPNYSPVPPNVRGEIYSFPEGGAIHIGSRGVLQLEHCTVTGNRSPSTAGIQLGFVSKLLMKNSVIAGNLSTRGEFSDLFFNADGSDGESLGHCFVGEFSSPNFAIKQRGYRLNQAWRQALNKDQLGTRDAPLDPMLAPLGDYGGPVPTMPPLPDSPLIDQIDTDEDGTPETDIGAAEFVPAR